MSGWFGRVLVPTLFASVLMLDVANFAIAGTVDTLRSDFAAPPATARPRVWWHWMNGNVTKDGIAKDIAWMQRAA